MAAGVISLRNQAGNFCADRLACRGAALHAASVAEARRVVQAVALVKKIQLRIVAVLLSQDRRPVHTKAKVSKPSAAGVAALLSRHVLVEVNLVVSLANAVFDAARRLPQLDLLG